MMKQLKEICYKESSNISQKSLAEKTGCYAVYGASGYLKDIDTFQQSEPYIGIVKDGSGVGRVNLYPEKTSLLSTLQYIKPKEGTNLRFLFYALNSIDYKKFLEGAAIPHIYFRDYGEELVYCPPLSEQTRIVSLLDDAFGKLERSREKALKLLDDAKEIFQAQLKKEMTPKKGWEVKTVKEIAFIKSGFAFKSSDFKTKGEYQVIRMGNIRPNLLRLNENPVFVSSENKEMIEKAGLIEGDVIITQTGTKGKRDYGYTVMIDRKNLLLNQRIACVRFPEYKTAKFYMYYSWTEEFKNQFFADEGGTVGQGNVGISAIKDTKISLPQLSEQSSIVSRLDVLSSQLKQIEEKTNKYLADLDELKQSLLKKAFEGKL